MIPSPVRGFRPGRRVLLRTVNLPKLEMVIGSPFWRIALKRSRIPSSSVPASRSVIPNCAVSRLVISSLRIWPLFGFKLLETERCNAHHLVPGYLDVPVLFQATQDSLDLRCVVRVKTKGERVIDNGTFLLEMR